MEWGPAIEFAERPVSYVTHIYDHLPWQVNFVGSLLVASIILLIAIAVEHWYESKKRARWERWRNKK